MGATKFLIVLLFFLLLNVQLSSPSSIGLNLVNTLRRKLLQVTSTFTTMTPDNTHLKLCETDVCDTRRPDGPRSQGLCDRWARGDRCPEEQIFHVQGDPGSNDKAEMFFNLRSPWDVACEKGTCEPSLGAVYNVFVAEGCIPEQDYISEMQDTSDRVSKQVKIYLRRKAEFYITVQRRPGLDFGPNSNCSFGMTVGSIEAQSDSAKCFDFRRIKRGEAAAANIPNCREVMPQYQSFQQPDTSAEATFVVALIGLGILVLALLVLGGVLLRRWSRRKALKQKDLNDEFGGVQPGASSSLTLAAAQPVQTKGMVVVNVLAPEPREEDEPRRKQRAPGVRTKQDRERLEQRMDQIEDGADEDEVDQDELGGNAGVLGGRGSSAIQFKQGRGGSKLVMGGGKVAMGAASRASDRPESGSSGSGSEAGRGSPADELYRSRLTAKFVHNSPGGSRVPTPPDVGQGPRGAAPRRAAGSRGSTSSSVAGDDIEFSMKNRSESGGSTAEWEDGTGIRIDDILAQARGAAAAAAGGKGTPDRTRAWKPGERSPAPSGGSGGGDRSSSIAGSSSGSGEGVSNDLPLGAAVRKPAPPAPTLLAGAAGRPRPPVMAPLMAARLGIKPQQAIGGRTMATLGQGKTEVGPTTAPTTAARTVMLHSVAPLRQVADLPVAGQRGVPLPPPARGGAAMPPPHAMALNGNGNSSNGAAGERSRPPPGGADAWRTPTGTLTGVAQILPVGQVGVRPPMGGAAGANGRDGRGMARLGGRRGATEQHVIEEDD